MPQPPNVTADELLRVASLLVWVLQVQPVPAAVAAPAVAAAVGAAIVAASAALLTNKLHGSAALDEPVDGALRVRRRRVR